VLTCAGDGSGGHEGGSRNAKTPLQSLSDRPHSVIHFPPRGNYVTTYHGTAALCKLEQITGQDEIVN